MAEPTHYCDKCGQKIRKLNPHSMDYQKVRVLEDIAKLNEKGHGWVLAKEGEALETEDGEKFRTAYRARAHASRLVWFGLLDYQGTRSGAFRVNQKGLEFLGGHISVPEKIYCRDGEVIEKSGEEVWISQVRDVAFDKAYWDSYWTKQKYPDTSPKDHSLF